jgi:glycine reductase
MRVVHYLNQFFAGLGGEAQAGLPPTARPGAVGPGVVLSEALGGHAEVAGTVVCGDGWFADHGDAAADAVLRLIATAGPDVVVAGPAFNAGRYGLACARVCLETQRRLGRPAVTAMHPDNVAVDLYRRDVVIAPTGPTATGMREAARGLARLALKLGAGVPLGPATVDGYLPRGFRVNDQIERSASARARAMLLARLRGESFVTELALPRYERVVPPPPVPDLRRARVAIVTEAGLVPAGNPDRLEVVWATKWLSYSVAGRDALRRGDWDVAHGGYDASHALADPHRVVPLDALRELARRGEVGDVLDRYYVTCGAHAVLTTIAQHGREIAAQLREQHVDGALLVAT